MGVIDDLENVGAGVRRTDGRPVPEHDTTGKRSHHKVGNHAAGLQPPSLHALDKRARPGRGFVFCHALEDRQLRKASSEPHELARALASPLK
jgi:hypothetical protein